MAEQQKGNIAIRFAGIEITNLAENAITYDLGELGDTVSALDTVVHLRKNKNTIVSGVNVSVVKGSENEALLLAAVATGVNTLTIRDGGIGFNGAMPSANPTQFAVSDSTNALDVETYTVTFKGVLNLFLGI